MDAFDILGALVGKKSSRGGTGGNILKDILSRRSAPKRPSQPTQEQRPPAHPEQPRIRPLDKPPRGGGLSLEDLMRGSNDRHVRRQAPEPERLPAEAPLPQHDSSAANLQAKILVRAMVAAAKADGQIDRSEQTEIVNHFGDNLSQEQLNFLREEFSREESVRDFCWSVPLGMEEHVYAASVMSIDLDQNSEAKYLQELAHGLRLAPEDCNEIHDRFKAPRIFR